LSNRILGTVLFLHWEGRYYEHTLTMWQQLLLFREGSSTTDRGNKEGHSLPSWIAYPQRALYLHFHLVSNKTSSYSLTQLRQGSMYTVCACELVIVTPLVV